MGYAAGTSVDPSKSRVEIERLLQRQGCDRVGVMHEPGFATVYFTRQGWEVQMRIPLPSLDQAPQRQARRSWLYTTPAQREAWVEQRHRERWRQLLLVLKAKFTALEEGVETFEQTFLAHIVLGGVHLGDRLLPAVREAKAKGGPLLLPAGDQR